MSFHRHVAGAHDALVELTRRRLRSARTPSPAQSGYASAKRSVGMPPEPLEGVAMPKTNKFVLSLIPLMLGVVGCSSSGNSLSNGTTTTTTIFVPPTLSATTTTQISPETTLPPDTTTSTTTPVISPTATDWEVVAGIFTTSAKAQARIDALTAAKFTGFSIKPVTAKFAAVLPGLTNAAATAMVAKIKAAGIGSPYVFHLTGAAATNFEVVAGIYAKSAEAQAQIDKLTKANFLGFTIKPTSGKFAAVLPGLTSVQAASLVSQINTAKLGPAHTKQLN
jgi:cell division septation protein DedD